MPGLGFSARLLDGVTGTGAGNAIGDARSMRYGNSSSAVNSNRYPWYTKIRAQLVDTTSGGTCTIQTQDSPDGSTWTTRYTRVLLIPTGSIKIAGAWLFKLTPLAVYFRLNVSAISGGSAPTLYAYGSLGKFDV